VRPAAVRLVTQQGLQISGGGKPSQRISEQVGLSGYGRIVEVEVNDVIGERALVDVVAT
jgi:hypothetical protein